ncbi:hypothetical protein [Limnoglobus roseus]|uniref:Uncharacterized protein n=1 Tax=Limnoglobus roseus TaxID=2598579 RepID=A0A5C1AR04_9BACT|nr:hypothetical protein [Limnoglobus roseus]QEL20483.1 hypothetical protein PX52LOC_07585 [Limnoglobus roseus]
MTRSPPGARFVDLAPGGASAVAALDGATYRGAALIVRDLWEAVTINGEAPGRWPDT